MSWDNTNKYLDDIERRLEEVMARPVQPDYQEGPGAGAAYLDLLKEGIGKLLEWRASQTTPYNMESYMNPSDEQLMNMIPMSGAVRKLGRGNKAMSWEMLGQKTGQSSLPEGYEIVPNVKPEHYWAKTPATAEATGWQMPEGMTAKGTWDKARAQLLNSLSEMFEPEKLGAYAPPKYAMDLPKSQSPVPMRGGQGGPSVMTKEEVAQIMGSGPMKGLQTGSDQYVFNAGEATMPYATQRAPQRSDALQQRIALEAMGITNPESAAQVGASIPRTPPPSSPSGGILNQQFDMKDTLVALLEKVIGTENVSAMNNFIRPPENPMGILRALLPLIIGGPATIATAYKYPFPSNIDMNSLQDPRLGNRTSAKDIEQRGMYDPNFTEYGPQQKKVLQDEMLAKRIATGAGY